jgi:hypothetical protein
MAALVVAAAATYRGRTHRHQTTTTTPRTQGGCRWSLPSGPPSIGERRKPFKDEVTFTAPAWAAHVSVGFDGLMTRKVSIPKR